MPTYDFRAKFEPGWLFGIPHGTELVAPTGTRPTYSVEAGSLRPISHGTLPIYRREGEKISLSLERNGNKIEFNDNFIYLIFESENPRSAYKKVFSVLDDLAHSLSLMTYQKFNFEIISGYETVNDVASIPVPIPHQLTWRVKSYNLENLREQISQSIDIAFSIDETLRKALEYFNHAMFLDKIQTEYAFTEPEQVNYLIADMILSLHKSVTVIVGEPRDREYKRKIKQFGFNEKDWEEKIVKLRTIRNEWDVAHHRRTKEKLNQIRSVSKEAFDISKSVIMKYSSARI